MKSNSIEIKHDEKQAILIGVLDFSNVCTVLNAGINYITQTQAPIFDFQEIHKANSAALALMLAWWREAVAAYT
jgi:ABC-type transporter Mla MlaB component